MKLFLILLVIAAVVFLALRNDTIRATVVGVVGSLLSKVGLPNVTSLLNKLTGL